MQKTTSKQAASSGLKRLAQTLSSGAAVLSLGALITGCGVGGSTHSVPTAITGAALHGAIHGGQQPVSGATLQLYAAGSTGYGSTAAPLIGSTVKSRADGSFTITGDYTCPSASALVYLVATQGDAGYTTNANLAMMTALGACGNLTPSTFVAINEITTVASVYALAPFMAGIDHLGTTSTNTVGLANAFTDVNLLTNTATGSAPGGSVAAGVTVPVAKIYTLADIVAACINSAGGTYNDSSPCGKLFFNANPGGVSATAPSDTITALMNIAQHPATSTANVAALYNLVTPTAPFQPTLPTQPNDFTVAVALSAGNLSSPSALAADANGNVWITNSTGNTVTEYSHVGTLLSGTGYTAGFNAPSSIAIDPSNNLWITNKANNTVSRISGTTGAAIGGSPYSGGGLNQPRSIAFDSFGTAWIANTNSSVTTINNAGTILTNYTPAAATAPLAIAVSPH